jgi:L,D-transpeptidase YcbB
MLGLVTLGGADARLARGADGSASNEYQRTLGALLSLVGDLVPESPSADSDSYSGSLVTAVRRFQARHGLEPDGRLGKGMLGQLNTPLGFRVRQMELALEQWRRIPYDPSRPAILLNLPEFRLRAFGAAISPSLKRRL